MISRSSTWKPCQVLGVLLTTIFSMAKAAVCCVPTRLPKSRLKFLITRVGSFGPVISSVTTKGSSSVPFPVTETSRKLPSSSEKVRPSTVTGSAIAAPAYVQGDSMKAAAKARRRTAIRSKSPRLPHRRAACHHYAMVSMVYGIEEKWEGNVDFGTPGTTYGQEGDEPPPNQRRGRCVS